MTPQQILEIARDGDLETMRVERSAVADAVRQFAALGDAASALELVGRTWRAWLSHGELEEGSAVIATALAIPSERSAALWHVRVLCADGLLAFRAGDQQRSQASNEKALEIARQIGDVRGECDALTGLARVALRDGRHEGVVALARHAMDRATSAGDRDAGAAPLHLLAAGTRLLGDYPAARELYLESLDLNREIGNLARVSTELHNLGWVELHLGKVDEAREWFLERDAAGSGDAYGDAWASLNWSAVAAAQGEMAEAQRLFASGSRALDKVGGHLDPDDLAELEWLRAQLSSFLD